MWQQVKADERGLVPTVVQDAVSGAVLMLAYQNEAAFNLTRATGRMHYYSRSRQQLWEKGATSGHYQQVVDSAIDCDGDALLYRVRQVGVACHTGNFSCFFTPLEESQEPIGSAAVIGELYAVLQERKRLSPSGSYTAKLFVSGIDRIAQKVGEEAVETVIAAKNDNRQLFIGEMADLWFHSLVLLAAKDVAPEAIFRELKDRRE